MIDSILPCGESSPLIEILALRKNFAMFGSAIHSLIVSDAAQTGRCGDAARLDVLNQWWRGSWWRSNPPAVPFASDWGADS